MKFQSFNYVIALIVGVTGIVLVTILGAVAEPPSASSSPTADNKQCVETTEIMRRNHMKFILHQRDETVHQGIRTSKHSLAGCIECHAKQDDQGNFISVNDPKHFCKGCHTYAAVQIDCFQCHNSKPASAQPTRATDVHHSGH